MQKGSTCELMLCPAVMFAGLIAPVTGAAPGDGAASAAPFAPCFAPTERASAEVADRDKPGSSGGRNRERGSQVAVASALASRVSQGSERGGFEPPVPV